MRLVVMCDGPVPHPRMNYRGEAFVRLLPRGEHTVYLIAAGVAGSAGLRPDITVVPLSFGNYVPVGGLTSLPLRLIQLLRMLLLARRVMRQDIDLIRSISILPTAVAVIARGRRRVPIIANASDFYSDIYAGSKLPFRKFAGWLIRRLELLCSRVECLIVDTAAQRDRWATRALDSKRCSVIPHGLPRSWGRSAGSDMQTLCQPAQQRSGPPTVFYVGDISEMDGVDILISAAQTLRSEGNPVRLLIVGTGTNAYWHHLQALIRRASLVDLVDHIPSVPNDQLPGIIQQVQVCVAPFRLRETSSTSIPNKVLEYLTAWKPIIVPSGSALQDIFGPAFTYFKPEDSDSLAHALEDAIVRQPSTHFLAMRRLIQHALEWRAIVDQEWALVECVTASCGELDLRTFDYDLKAHLEGGFASLG